MSSRRIFVRVCRRRKECVRLRLRLLSPRLPRPDIASPEVGPDVELGVDVDVRLARRVERRGETWPMGVANVDRSSKFKSGEVPANSSRGRSGIDSDQ
jgi:hypothetical protein